MIQEAQGSEATYLRPLLVSSLTVGVCPFLSFLPLPLLSFSSWSPNIQQCSSQVWGEQTLFSLGFSAAIRKVLKGLGRHIKWYFEDCAVERRLIHLRCLWQKIKTENVLISKTVFHPFNATCHLRETPSPCLRYVKAPLCIPSDNTAIPRAPSTWPSCSWTKGLWNLHERIYPISSILLHVLLH